MFQFRRFPSIRYGLAYGCMRYAHAGFPIQTSADQWIFAPPRSFSQLITSFIASESLGIHHTPFIIYFNFILLAYSEIIHVVRLYMISIFAHCCGIYFSIFPVCQRTVTLTSTDRLKGIEPFPCSENLCFLPPGCQLMVKVEGFASKCR